MVKIYHYHLTQDPIEHRYNLGVYYYYMLSRILWKIWWLYPGCQVRCWVHLARIMRYWLFDELQGVRFQVIIKLIFSVFAFQACRAHRSECWSVCWDIVSG